MNKNVGEGLRKGLSCSRVEGLLIASLSRGVCEGSAGGDI